MNKIALVATKLMAGVEISDEGFKTLTISDIIAKLYEVAIILRNISLPIAVISLIIAGVMWMMPSQRQGGGFGLIVKVVIGSMFILLSVTLVQIVVNLFS